MIKNMIEINDEVISYLIKKHLPDYALINKQYHYKTRTIINRLMKKDKYEDLYIAVLVNNNDDAIQKNRMQIACKFVDNKYRIDLYSKALVNKDNEILTIETFVGEELCKRAKNWNVVDHKDITVPFYEGKKEQLGRCLWIDKPQEKTLVEVYGK